jgi:sulfite exporter TauE/SafE
MESARLLEMPAAGVFHGSGGEDLNMILTALLLGLAGGLHCAGMCGPLALALPQSGPGRTRFLVSRLAYNLGRIATYCLLGLVFGLIGRSFWLAGVQRWLSIGLGILLLVSLTTASRLGAWRPISWAVNALKSNMSALLRRRSLGSVALLGLLNGFLPCGLVYVAGAGATATGDIMKGVEFMAAFGAGTLPTVLAISLSGRLAPMSLRLRLRKAVPVSVAVLGLLLILRGAGLGIPWVSPGDSKDGLACCQQKHTP